MLTVFVRPMRDADDDPREFKSHSSRATLAGLEVALDSFRLDVGRSPTTEERLDEIP